MVYGPWTIFTNMNNLFEPAIAVAILSRLQKIHADTKPLWGKMNAAQMMAHCQAPFEVYFGNLKLKRGLIGILFGGIAKKKLSSEKPWKRNLPTAKEFIVTDDKNFEEERNKLIELINRFNTQNSRDSVFIHPFFGKMTADEWGLLGYKHLDHHLQQFGV
jgi:hypothetical protein